MKQPKRRYPAHLFKHRWKYPTRLCQHCHGPILPLIKKQRTGNGRPCLESPTQYLGRKYCSKGCATAGRHTKLGKQKREQKAEPAPSVPAIAVTKSAKPKAKVTTKRRQATTKNGKISPAFAKATMLFCKRWGVRFPYQITGTSEEALREWSIIVDQYGSKQGSSSRFRTYEADHQSAKR